MRRLPWILLGTALIAGLLLVLLRKRPPSSAGRLPPQETAAPRPDSKFEFPSPPSGGTREDLLNWARRVREEVLDSPALLQEIVERLRDPSTPTHVRQALAVVLGSLHGPEGKRALLDLLRTGGAAGLERTVILALGMMTIEDGDVFARDGQPGAVEAAPGLVVFVAGPVELPGAREELARRLRDSSEPAHRLAAARVLRDSTSFPDARLALLERTRHETEGEIAAEAASSLAVWSRGVDPADSERSVVMGALLDAAPQGEEVVRFRLTAPFATTPLAPGEADRLARLASDASADVRRFAVEVIGRRPRRPEAIPLLTHALSDADPQVRETAALALGRSAAQALGPLLSALRQDPDPEVRAAAARSLSSLPEAKDALRAAAEQDPDPAVRRAARP